jgi:hypothetical protein
MSEWAKWCRVKPSYPKPAGGFLAIGPRYAGELTEDKAAVRFVHHGDRTWTEVVPIEHVEAAPDPLTVRRRWK